MVNINSSNYVFSVDGFDRLKSENVRLRADNAGLQADNVHLVARIEELERQISLNSSNSSKPPSSDGLKKPKTEPRTKSLRRSSGNKPGGQKGHKGGTLRQTADPDHVEDHFPPICGKCGVPLPPATTEGYAIRQVFDMDVPQPLVATEHRAHACLCGKCGKITRAKFPATVKAAVQYGPRLAGIVTYLRCAHFLPEDRLAQVMADLFHVFPAPATLAAVCRKTAERLEVVVSHVQDLISQQAHVKHLDETGFRVGGQTRWLHVACTTLLSLYRASSKRGDMLQGVTGCIVHDHWKPYFTLHGVSHALCNAHHLRELQALRDLEKEGWAGQMQCLLRRAQRVAQAGRNKGVPIAASLIKRIERRYDTIITAALGFHEAQPPLRSEKSGKQGRKKRRIGHNLALRLRDHKEGTLRFLSDSEVPFTNNEAERDLRMMKLCQKIFGGFRSEQGARDFATLRSVITTARKQGWNIIDSLMQPPDQIISNLQHT